MVFRQIFSGLNHTTNHAKTLDRLAHHPPTRQAIMQRQIARTNAFANVRGVMFNI
jgi:hypothetical protein